MAQGGTHWRAVSALLAVQLLFGAFPVAAKFAFRDIEPLALSAIRVVAGGLLLAMFQRILVGEPLRDRRDHLVLAGLAVLGVVLNQVLFVLGLARTTVLNAIVLVTAIPILTMLVALVMRKEPARRGKLVGIGLAMTGVLILLGVENLDFRSQYFVGNLLVFANSLSYAFFLVLSKPVLTRYHPLTLAKWTFLYGALLIIPVALVDVSRTDWGAVSGVAWGAVAFIILGPSMLTYWLNNYALSHVEASTVAFYIYLQPLIATLLAVPLLGEEITTRTLVAAAFIFSGVAVATWGRRVVRRLLTEVPVAATKTFREEGEPGPGERRQG